MKNKSKIKTEAETTILQPIGEDWTDHPIEEYTNEGSTSFCPYIDNNRLAKLICSKKGVGILHRSVYTRVPGPYDMASFDEIRKNGVNPRNRKYHWVQIGFKSYQCCKFQRDPVSTDDDLCQYHFKSCQVYKENIKK